MAEAVFQRSTSFALRYHSISLTRNSLNMSSVNMWSKNFFLEFLEIYRKNECLWKVKSKDYYNKAKKKDGYAQLLAKGRTVDPNFTEDDVKKKINNFRSSFRKEYKKVSASIAGVYGAVESELYVPKLWYYDQLLFLKDEEKDEEKEEEQSEGDTEPENSETDLTEESFINTPSSFSTKRKRTLSTPSPENQEPIFVTQANDMMHYEDNFDIVGKNIALKLRQLRKDQSIIAEKLINDVIFEAQFNNLNKHAQIVIPSLHPDMLVSTSELTEDD